MHTDAAPRRPPAPGPPEERGSRSSRAGPLEGLSCGDENERNPAAPLRRRQLPCALTEASRPPAKGSDEDPEEALPGSGSEPEEEPLLSKGSQGSLSSWAREGRPDGLHLPINNGQSSSLSANPVQWFHMLQLQYGTRLLLLLFSSQHLLKGVVQQFQTSAAMWLAREYSLSAPQSQIYLSIASSPWALKPVIGAISDTCPLLGYRKAPYIILASMVGVGCCALIGFSTKETASMLAIVLFLFGMSLQASTCDLLTEAKYSEHLQGKPAHGPDLLTFVWGGITVGNIVAISTVGWLITTFGVRSVFLVCMLPAAAILVPTFANCFEETPLSPRSTSRIRAAFVQQGEVLFLCLLMTVLTSFMSLVGAVSDSHKVHCASALLVLVVLLPCFHATLRPEIARVNTFFVLQAALSLNISGATFYFYTDQEKQYPEGPHFSPWFYATVLGFMGSLMSLVGLATYTRYLKDCSYRSLLLLANIAVTFLCLLDAMMFRRLNLRLGIPDAAFVLGSSASTNAIRQWQWMPGIVLMSQLCPVGMEATMFALLAGCSNIGSQIADYLGAYTLDVLGIHPQGSDGESQQFENLWKASVISTVLPALTIALIPALIPSAKQTDKLLLKDAESAVAGSPLSKWRQSRSEEGQGGSSRTCMGHLWDVRRPVPSAGHLLTGPVHRL